MSFIKLSFIFKFILQCCRNNPDDFDDFNRNFPTSSSYESIIASHGDQCQLKNQTIEPNASDLNSEIPNLYLLIGLTAGVIFIAITLITVSCYCLRRKKTNYKVGKRDPTPKNTLKNSMIVRDGTLSRSFTGTEFGTSAFNTGKRIEFEDKP